MKASSNEKLLNSKLFCININVKNIMLDKNLIINNLLLNMRIIQFNKVIKIFLNH